MKLKDYLYIDNISGENFFVECHNKQEAIQILKDNDFDLTEIEYIGEYDPNVAEMMGLDTY